MRISGNPIHPPAQTDTQTRTARPVRTEKDAPELSRVEKQTLQTLFSPAAKGNAAYKNLESMQQRIRLGQYVDTRA